MWFRHSGGSEQAGRKRVSVTTLAATITLLAAFGCAAAPSTDTTAVAEAPAVDVGLANLNATLWVQTAVEYRGTSLQAYALGTRLLDEALADPSWTAYLGQSGDFGALPPAVIMDIDETVLDNSYYEARLVLDHQSYSDETWDAWVLQEASAAVPGAPEFIRAAIGKGVKVFFVTNRRAHLEQATRNNFAALDIPLDADADNLLLRGERPEWEASDKTPRWDVVAADHRILLMFGDNMGDFTSAASGTVAERSAFAEQHRDYWGSKWITLANPTYGSFMSSVLDNDFSLTVAQQNARKRAALDPKR